MFLRLCCRAPFTETNPPNLPCVVIFSISAGTAAPANATAGNSECPLVRVPLAGLDRLRIAPCQIHVCYAHRWKSQASLRLCWPDEHSRPTDPGDPDSN